MSNLLIEEPPLQVLPSLAMAVGLNEAIILQQIHYWLRHKQADREKYAGSFREGRWWVYNSVEEWRRQFPFWSADTIARALTSLKRQEVVTVRQFNKAEWDRTNWYAIDYERLKAAAVPLPDLRQSKGAKRGQRDPQSAVIEGGQPAAVKGGRTPASLTETTPETTQKIHQRVAASPPEVTASLSGGEGKELPVRAAQRALDAAQSPFAIARRQERAKKGDMP